MRQKTGVRRAALRALPVLVLLAAHCAEDRREDVHRFEADVIGTIGEITVVGTDAAEAERLVGRVNGRINRLERLLSAYLPESDVGRVNSAAGFEPVEVSSATLSVVETALDVAQRSNGAFDITVGPLIDLWRFSDPPHPPPGKADIERIGRLVDYRSVLTNAGDSTVFVSRSGMEIDLGGIAKGEILDQAREIFKNSRARGALVTLGGDMAGFRRDGTPWRIGIQHPRRAGIIGILELTSGAVATSGDYERGFTWEGRRYHHLLDPSSGRPATAAVSATVKASSARLADALATAAFVLGPERGMELLESYPEAEAVIVFERENELDFTISSGLQKSLSIVFEGEGAPDHDAAGN